MDSTLQKFWEIENEGVQEKSVMSMKDRDIYESTEKTVKFEDNHYVVEIPWKENRNELLNNYEMAKRRLESTEKKLRKEPVVEKMYNETLQGYLTKGYIEKVETDEKEESLKENNWLLPHFPVVKMNKDTTKVRIVFDASASCKGASLNDVIEQGPSLQNNLFDVLLRFRRDKIAVACDIQEMYLRVGITPPDRRFHRFLWRPSPELEPDVYQFNRLVFGVNASPFLAQFVSQYNARLYENEYPLAAETVLKSTYMDDSMDSVDNDKVAIRLYKELTALWEKAGMNARKWISNSKTVLEQIPVEHRAKTVDLQKNELPKVKTLGVTWVPEEDIFSFEFTAVDENKGMTKREYLKKISTLFDPLGLLTPYTIIAKMLMQDIWISGVDWDEKVHEKTRIKIGDWFEELACVHQIKVPRCISSYERTEKLTLHAFSDASQSAYGAAVYARCQHEKSEISVILVASKSRVAPISAISIPRLELMAAQLSAQLTSNICEALEIDISECTFWTDSMDVVFWVRNQSRVFKTFVANRVGEIQKRTTPSQWRHIPGKQNPSDLLSRGLNITKLIEDKTWWEGPEFLKENEPEWPQTSVPESKERQEMKKSANEKNDEKTFNVNAKDSFTMKDIETRSAKQPNVWRLDPTRYSSWKRLKRVNAWVMRFIQNCLLNSEDRKVGELTFDELQDSERQITQATQKKQFPEYRDIVNGKLLQKNSILLSLNPVSDTDGVIRSSSRLKYADFMPFESRNPIILPRHSWTTKLIVRDIHEKNGHSGTNLTLSELSTRYWVIHAREVIREVENLCSECKRRKAKPAQQIMAPLPQIRLNMPLRAFAHVAVDYGGPFLTKQGRGKSRQKRYLCLFTCLASRAVHLEVAYALDTSSFLNAFYRMVSRRGLPVKVLSDNGKNFVGAEKELKQLVKLFDDKEIIKRTADKGIDWQFNPPLAPHWGGVHEIMIKAAKRAIFAILHGADVTDEELTTAFVGAESLINSRPLTYQTANPADVTPLTPNHFLFGQVGGQFAPQSVDIVAYHPLNRWRRVQELMRHFWQRWLKEWLPSLAPRRRWFQGKRDLAVGDVVLVVAPDTQRGQWPLGRIVEVYPGVDGHVRSARVFVNGKDMKRPIVKLCPLECDV
ncbi:uncharacterized protein LOC128246076 [Mya arenaria]|uniref:uncharacterized protein LOC128246076 n=1 Tax=Mya arenaria TaxID=6604 RepID=UPI0022E5AA79|nr:uncharacterized protein LOC128246076 [Mya arenaria]